MVPVDVKGRRRVVTGYVAVVPGVRVNAGFGRPQYDHLDRVLFNTLKYSGCGVSQRRGDARGGGLNSGIAYVSWCQADFRVSSVWPASVPLKCDETVG